MNPLEEAIRDHLRLRGQSEVTDDELEDLLGRSSPETEAPLCFDPRSSYPSPRPGEAPQRLGARAPTRPRVLRPALARLAGEVARSSNQAVEVVRPQLPRLALALGSLAFITILVPAGVAAARYDRIVGDLKVGGVPIGGLSAEAAERRLDQQFAAAHRESIVLRSGRRRWRFTPSQSRVSVDVSRAVSSALEASRRKSFPKRFLQALRGERSAEMPAPVTVSEAAVDGLTRRVAGAIERRPLDATVRPSGRRLLRVPDRAGVAVHRGALERLVRSRLASARAPRELEVPTESVGAKVTLADLPRRYGSYVVVRRSAFRLDYFQGLRRRRSYAIAVGMQGLETPAGEYEIQGKQVNPVWHVPDSRWAGSKAGEVIPPGPNNPIKARWLGFNGSAGIHGTTELGSLGQAASHGCVRMSIPDVKDLYRRVRVGTPVRIE